MHKLRHALLLGSVSLLASVAVASPLNMLFGGEPKAAPAIPAPASVKRLGDSELNCAALHAEVNRLEAVMAKPQADRQGNAPATGKALVSGLAQGLLSAAPLLGDGSRGSMVAGLLVSQTATAQAQNSAQQAQQVQIDAATASQRRDHLVELFEGKRCKLSELKE